MKIFKKWIGRWRPRKPDAFHFKPIDLGIDGLAESAKTKEQNLPLGSPAYYEVWGGLESANKALWAALWASLTVTLLALILLRIQMSRPPIVIKVSERGEAVAVDNPTHQPAVGSVEIKNFISLFENFFTELDCYTYDHDLKLAFSMMTPEFQAKSNDMLKQKGVINALIANQTKTQLFLEELSIVKDTSDLLECHVKGYREIGSFRPNGPTGEVVFEDVIILKRVPRSEQSPYGVLVEDFIEIPFLKK